MTKTTFKTIISSSLALLLLSACTEKEEISKEKSTVIDHKIDWNQGVDLFGITLEAGHGAAHGCQIDDRWHTGEILKQHPRRHEGDLLGWCRRGVPVGYSLDVVRGSG